MKENPKLLKVTMEFDDHTQWLEGKEAEEWLRCCNSFITLGFVHGSQMPKFRWVVEFKEVK